MELEIVGKKENPFLKRTEVSFRVTHPREPTPGRAALRRAARVPGVREGVQVQGGRPEGRAEAHPRAERPDRGRGEGGEARRREGPAAQARGGPAARGEGSAQAGRV